MLQTETELLFYSLKNSNRRNKLALYVFLNSSRFPLSNFLIKVVSKILFEWTINTLLHTNTQYNGLSGKFLNGKVDKPQRKYIL